MLPTIMRYYQTSLLCLILIFSSASIASTKGQSIDRLIDINFKRYRLDNGLTLLVHEDHKAPIVAVNIWYHVGSKDERPSRTGFAHLFEHLMFNGSENYDHDWFIALEKLGGTDINGTTSFDRTNYFQTLPNTALDGILWLESDRMGNFINTVDQDRLDEQRDVVKNEKRQGENQPYGRIWPTMLKGMFDPGHPYRSPTIGSTEDIDAASLEDVREWFETYYGAANAVLVVAGDVDPEQVYTKVKHYFGDIPSGPPLTKAKFNIGKHQGSKRDIMYDHISQVRLIKAWNTSSFNQQDNAYLNLAASILGQGKNSRLYRQLVHEKHLASAVFASQYAFEIAGIFTIQVDVKPDVDNADVEAIINAELKQLMDKGPTKAELQRIKNAYFAQVTRNLEKIGGSTGKAQLLATYETYTGDADSYRQYLHQIAEATPKQIKMAVQRWLSDGDYNLELRPQPDYKQLNSTVDRSKLPYPKDFPSYIFPDVETFSLSNGIPVWLIQRHNLPLVKVGLQIGSGFADDPRSKLGLASLTAEMLTEGSRNMTTFDLINRLQELGAEIAIDADLDSSTAILTALTPHLEKSIKLYTKVLREPIFTEDSLKRQRSNWIDHIKQEQKKPASNALRKLPELLYPHTHPYAIPFTGTGKIDTVKSITTKDIRAFYQLHYQPSNAQLIVIGDTNREHIQPMLERYLGNWKDGEKPHQRSPVVDIPMREYPTIYLIDKPNSPQSLILAGQLLPPGNAGKNLPLDMAIRILGGTFNSRINMDLREDKGWSYGAKVFSAKAKLQQALLYHTSVQTDKTADSVVAIIDELQHYRTDNPPTKEELQRNRQGILAGLPSSLETADALLSTLLNLSIFNQNIDDIDSRQRDLRKLDVKSIRQAAKQYLQPDSMIWLIIGDMQVIKPALEQLNIADVIVLETDNIVAPY